MTVNYKMQKKPTTAYLVSNNRAIASIDTSLSGGSLVRYSKQYVEDPHTQRKLLVNARNAKVSRAKKWEQAYFALKYEVGRGFAVSEDESDFLVI